SEHILNVDETEFPEKYREIIRRLRKAAESEEMREIMHVEDEVFEELAAGERAAEERDRALAIIAEKDSAIAERDKALADKDQQLIRTVQNLARAGHASAEISEITGLSAKAITEILTPSNRVCSPRATYSSKKKSKKD
ncbi:MAG TPA: hypothetical protein PKN29_12500, partial [Candidatus Ozemobacteraceae bacterium]|nr:hypothetical protein [Candidatus Ozemobacteraceae bacterium]